ncbi:MAG TPA: hypothetical protein VJR29_11415 [bacterium]|nr:hypothetical protein [bacterium]
MTQVSCENCSTREITQERSAGINFSIVVTDEDAQSFTKDIPFNDNILSGTFQFNDFYIFDTRPQPQDNTSFQFYFAANALPNGEDIFDQTSGEVFTFAITPYDGEQIIYREIAPQIPEWIPTTYSGTVEITDPTHVKFDLTFTDGIQSREIIALFYFETVTFDQPTGECN